jgi:hypothetical protein
VVEEDCCGFWLGWVIISSVFLGRIGDRGSGAPFGRRGTVEILS